MHTHVCLYIHVIAGIILWHSCVAWLCLQIGHHPLCRNDHHFVSLIIVALISTKTLGLNVIPKWCDFNFLIYNFLNIFILLICLMLFLFFHAQVVLDSCSSIRSLVYIMNLNYYGLQIF